MNDINLSIPRDVGMLRATIEFLQRELSILEDPNGLTPEEKKTPEVTLKDCFTKPTPAAEPETPSASFMFGDEKIPLVPTVPEVSENIDTSSANGEPLLETAATPTIELDPTGLPWDGRINVPKKTKRKSDGTWTLRRNIDSLIVEQVRAELRDLMAGVDISKTTGEKKATDILTPPPPPENTTDTIEPFPALLNKLTPRLSGEHGAEFQVKMNEVLVKKGIAQVGLLMSAPELIPEIDALLETAWNKLTSTQP